MIVRWAKGLYYIDVVEASKPHSCKPLTYAVHTAKLHYPINAEAEPTNLAEFLPLI